MTKFILRSVFLMVFLLSTVIIFLPQAFGIKAHEYVATIFLVAAIYHILKNHYFFKSCFKEHFAFFIYRDLLTLLLLTSFLVMLVTGVFISGNIFDFIKWPFQGFMRDLHLSCAIYAFVFLGLHLGLHAFSLFGLIKENLGATCLMLFKAGFVLVSLIGFYNFVTGDYLDRLMFQQSFSFFDYERALIFPLIDAGSVLVMFAQLGYLISLLTLNKRK